MLFKRTIARLERRRNTDRILATVLATTMVLAGAVAVSACGGQQQGARLEAGAPQEASPERGPSRETGTPGLVVDEAIRQIDDANFEIRRDTWDQLPSLADSDGRPRLVPTIKDGKRIGFKVFVIQPDSIPDRLGFKNGDTIHAINGQAVVEPEDFLSAYGDAKGKSEITVALTRRGTEITLHYSIL
ncbi:MAG: hypothetical protein GY811_21270 [Myxococcales bacterium]|nr:hypothetical protein [Myxococcales bacterium]